jgi:hypothetical protein
MATATVTGLKPSDYLQGASIVTGIVGGSNFVQNSFQAGGPTETGMIVTGIALLTTTILTSLSQWLQHLGH